jgi:ribose transport system substrate-binding protein
MQLMGKLAWAAGCAALLFSLSGCGGSAHKRMILLTNGDDPFWDAMRRGMEDAAKDLRLEDAGLRVILDKNDGTPKGQVDKLKQYANQTDIVAVAISVIDANNIAIADAMRTLRKQGIHVITVDSDINRRTGRDARFAYLGTDNVIGGQELGKAAKGLRPEGGEYAAFVGLKSAANAEERTSGFQEAAGPEFVRVEYLGDDYDLSVAAKNVRDALNRHPNLSTLVGIWAYNAHAIAEEVRDRGIRDRVSVVVFDAAPKAIRHMENGLIDAMVVQNPYEMGYSGTRLMKALVDGDTDTLREMFPSWNPETNEFAQQDGDILITGLKVVVPDRSSPLKLEMFAEGTEFLTLGEFQKWLTEKGLEGS